MALFLTLPPPLTPTSHCFVHGMFLFTRDLLRIICGSLCISLGSDHYLYWFAQFAYAGSIALSSKANVSAIARFQEFPKLQPFI